MSHPDECRYWKVRKQLSAVIWIALPVLTLFVSRITPWSDAFCTRPANSSYDAMFVAATAGIGITSILALVRHAQSNREPGNDRLRPSMSWRNAFDVFEILLCVTLSLCSFAARVPGSAWIWLIAFLILVLTSMAVAMEQKPLQFLALPRRRVLSSIASVILLICALLFLAGPVLHPDWAGPAQPYVRWHPFSHSGELIWRGIFLSFALGMVLTATDPLGRHRIFLRMLTASGYLHASEMAADNLFSLHMHSMNGNREHLYGDVLGWFVIATVSFSLLALSREPIRHLSPAICAEQDSLLPR
jgi:hypothetical protein